MDASDWMKGIFFSVLASFIGAASKLAIRKGWLTEEQDHRPVAQEPRVWNNVTSNSRFQRPDIIRDSHQHQQQQQPQRLPEPAIPLEDLIAADDQNDEDRPIGNRPHGRSIYTAVVEPEVLAVDLESTTTHSKSNGSCCCSPARWLRYTGMVGMTFLNPLFGLLAMNYASPSITAPFSGLTLVWVIVFSRPLLGEVPSCSQRVASMMIVTGEVMVAVFGDHSNTDATDKAAVEASYREGPFITYFVGLGIWMGLITLWIRSHATSPTLRRFAWGTSGGAITGFAQCFIKDSLIVIKTPDLLHHMPVYLPLFLLLAAATTFGGLLLLTATMKRYDCTYSAAMFVGSFVISTSTMSAAHYHTFEHLDGIVDLVMYPLGLFVLMVGLAILVEGRASTLRHGNDDNDDDNDMLAQVDHYIDVPEDDEPALSAILSGDIYDDAQAPSSASSSKSTAVGSSSQENADDLELI